MTRFPQIMRLVPLIMALTALPGVAHGEGPAIWAYQGGSGTVLMLGSVHVLRQQDYPLPTSVDAAYAAADTLVMEIDTSSIDPLSAQMLITGLGTLEAGRSMRSIMGQRDFERASRLAGKMGFDLMMMDQFEPWFAALTIMNLQMMRVGFNPQIGLESHLSGRAARDGKPILGLETMEFQLRLFDAMPERVQSKLLLQTLQEAESLETEMDAMIRSWRDGDSAALARMMGRNFAEFPEVYEALVTRRNRDWSRQIMEMGDRPGTHLVVVGALHLVGDDSLIRMLERRGLSVDRWRPED